MGKLEMIVGAVIAVAMLNIAGAQRVHVVGDSLGWVVPRDGASVYQNWAAAKEFAVGDTLTFNFETGNHDVVKVAKAAFDACTSSNPIGNVIIDGPANVTLDSAGDHYFICGIGQHCQRGQKLSITVSATPGAGGPTPSPTTPTPTPTTPSPGSSNPDDCAPTSEPTAHDPISPTNANSPSSPDNSSSSQALAGLFVPVIMPLLMGFFFF